MTVDMYGQHPLPTTIQGVAMDDIEWVEHASEAVNAVKGDTYVAFNRGLLTVNQINEMLTSIPMEVSFVDANQQLIYYNYHLEADEMLAPRAFTSVGLPLGEIYSGKPLEYLERMIDEMRQGIKPYRALHQPGPRKGIFRVRNYQAVYDSEGTYLGYTEWVHDIQPYVDFYLQETGQKAVNDQAEYRVAPKEPVPAIDKNYSELIDIFGGNPLSTTIQSVPIGAEDWLDKASAATEAVTGDTYVELARGVMTVDQLEMMLNSLPIELHYCDANAQFLYYNEHFGEEEMLAPREKWNLGNTMGVLHPRFIVDRIARRQYELHHHITPTYTIGQRNNNKHRVVSHNYFAYYDPTGRHLGTSGWVHDHQPHMQLFLDVNGMHLVDDPAHHEAVADAVATPSVPLDTFDEIGIDKATESR